MSKLCRNCGKPVEAFSAICRCGAPPGEGRNFCNACGDPTYSDESECSNCGQSLAVGQPSFSHTIVASNPPTDPGMIAALSVIPCPWLGQIFMGQTAKGFTMMFLSYALSIVGVGILLMPLAGFDAYRLAKELKNGGSIGPWDFFWSIGNKRV